MACQVSSLKLHGTPKDPRKGEIKASGRVRILGHLRLCGDDMKHERTCFSAYLIFENMSNMPDCFSPYSPCALSNRASIRATMAKPLSRMHETSLPQTTEIPTEA